MQLSKVGALLRRRWYLVLLALATFESFTVGWLVKLCGERIGWITLTLLVALSLYSILGTKRSGN